MRRFGSIFALALPFAVLTACGKDDDHDTGDHADHDHDADADADADADCVPGDAFAEADGYFYPSQFIDGESSVKYAGQTMRQMLITELRGYIGDLDDMIDGGSSFEAGEALSGLMYYFDFNSADADDTFYYAPDNAIQTTWGDISTKNLKGKIAGNDSATDHKNWTDLEDGTPSQFAGVDIDGVNSPESLVMHWFNEIEANVQTYQEGETEFPPYLTADGVDRQQLIQKFLTGAVTFSQGADDYTDNDVAGKGILASTEQYEKEGTLYAYSALEHQWDEGFGYFGAARNYGSLTAAEIKANDNDANGDGCIDLKTERNHGASVNAAKRDVGSADLSAPTDLVGEAWTGFYGGRTIIANAAHDATGLSDAEMVELVAHRDMAIGAWEKAIAATVIHYINDMIADISAYSADEMAGTVGTADATYSFNDYAKHWGEAKGFGLWFQFNPHSPMTDEQFAALHNALGLNAPGYVPGPGGDDMAFIDGLVTARDLIGTVYGFDTENVEAW